MKIKPNEEVDSVNLGSKQAMQSEQIEEHLHDAFISNNWIGKE